jgi:FCD domain
MDDELIRVCALATRVACQRMTPPHLKALRDSVDQACCLPTRTAWDRKVTAHAEVVNLLADAAADPVLALLVRDVPGELYDLMITVGPASSGIVASSRRRLVARITAGDAHGAAGEMEQHLKGLLWMQCLARGSVQNDVAVLPTGCRAGRKSRPRLTAPGLAHVANLLPNGVLRALHRWEDIRYCHVANRPTARLGGPRAGARGPPCW